MSLFARILLRSNRRGRSKHMTEYEITIRYRSGLVADAVKQMVCTALNVERKDVDIKNIE